MIKSMRENRFALVVSVWLAVGCSGDSSPGDGAVASQADAGSWPDLKVRQDSQPKSCTAGDPQGCGGDKSLLCLAGVCALCPEYYYNCDLAGDCECLGACDGASCVGTKKCSFEDSNVCGGDQDKWCDQGSCVACPDGQRNCDKTQDCECSGDCKGGKCA